MTRLYELAMQACPVALVVVDARDGLAYANDKARELLGGGARSGDPPIEQIEAACAGLALRALVAQARAENRVLARPGVQCAFRGDGAPRWFDVTVAPVGQESAAGAEVLGTSITFVEVTTALRLQDDLRALNAQLQAANRDLLASNAELEATNEALESTNAALRETHEDGAPRN